VVLGEDRLAQKVGGPGQLGGADHLLEPRLQPEPLDLDAGPEDRHRGPLQPFEGAVDGALEGALRERQHAGRQPAGGRAAGLAPGVLVDLDVDRPPPGERRVERAVDLRRGAPPRAHHLAGDHHVLDRLGVGGERAGRVVVEDPLVPLDVPILERGAADDERHRQLLDV
jgi:hypothetical protein